MEESIDKLKQGCIYQHYKGSYYYLMGFGKEEKTQESKVIYKEVGKSEIYIRPAKEFLQTGKTGKPRFRLVSKLINNDS